MEAVLQACFLLWTYALAAVPFGLVVTTLWGGPVDLRTAGSGNIGATNVARTFGWRLALPVLVLDVAKGALPVFFATALWPDWGLAWPALVAITAFLAHCFPIYLAFKGGKGVATGAGALLALTPKPLLVAAGIWGATLAATGRSSQAALVASASLVALTLLLDPGAIGVVLLIAAGIGLTHMTNIRRLVRGEEKEVVQPVRFAREESLTAAEALSQGPSGQPVDQPLWRASEVEAPADPVKEPST